MVHDPTAASEFMDPNSPHSIFRWEASPGLEHTCYACTTKMNNPKARQTCYGTHSIPCTRYHQTMHAIGTSHNCKACVTADSLHTDRHRKIAELIAEYKQLEEEEVASSVKHKKSKREPALTERDPNTPSQSGRRNAFLPPLEFNSDEENDEIDSQSLTTSTSTSSNSGPNIFTKLSKAETRAQKRAAKLVKSQKKSLKNQSKHLVTIKAADVEQVHTVLHGEDSPHDRTGEASASQSRHPLATDKSIEDVMNRNRAYVGNIQEHKAYLLRSIGGRKKVDREKRVRKQRQNAGLPVSDDGAWMDDDDAADQDAVVDAVLAKFGINAPVYSPGTMSSSKNENSVVITPKRSAHGSLNNRKDAVLANLRATIAEDLMKHENEQRQTCIRAGGFWRYVGRQVFERMLRVTEDLDWRTGMIRKDSKVEQQVEEVEDAGVDVVQDQGEEDESNQV